MKTLLLAVLSLACLASAWTIELEGRPVLLTEYAAQGLVDYNAPAFSIQPVPLTDIEFIYDSGSSTSYGSWASLGIRLAKRFDGADFGIGACFLTGFRVHYYGFGAGTATAVGSFYDDTGGWPDAGPQLWTGSTPITHSGFGWVDIPVDPPVYVDDAKFFGIFDWGSETDQGGVAVTFDPEDNDYQYYSGWSAGWYRYFIRAYVQVDMEPPYAENLYPEPGATGVAPDTDISLDILDDDPGVDGDSVKLFVNSVDVTADCDIIDNGDGSFSVTFSVPGSYSEGSTVEAKWEAEDGVGNFGTDTWTFTISGAAISETSWGAIKAR